MSVDTETRCALDEVIRHSNTRTGAVARAIEAGLVALAEGSVLARQHSQSLHEWVSMVSECGGVGDRWHRWRDAVWALLQALSGDVVVGKSPTGDATAPGGAA
jgi:hypothetical protein